MTGGELCHNWWRVVQQMVESSDLSAGELCPFCW